MIGSSPRKRPYLIGLTGPIGAGKSLARKMTEHLGALTIDADHLAHAVYAQGSPGFQPILERFGSRVLNDDGQVDRAALSRVVFEDPRALADLERIVHPLVALAVRNLIQVSPLPILVVEAIKLLESELKDLCDAIWVIDAPKEQLVRRLQSSRGMSPESIHARLRRQADFSSVATGSLSFIRNNGSMLDLWDSLLAQWHGLSLDSPRFSSALAEVNEILQSFYMPLVQVNPESARDLLSQFVEFPDFEGFFHYLCTHFVWEAVPTVAGRSFLVTSIDGPVMRVDASRGQIESSQVLHLFKLIEDFSILHLCSRVEIPEIQFESGVLEEIGYDKVANSAAFDLSGSGSRNFVFEKVIFPEMNLFWEYRDKDG